MRPTHRRIPPEQHFAVPVLLCGVPLQTTVVHENVACSVTAQSCGVRGCRGEMGRSARLHTQSAVHIEEN